MKKHLATTTTFTLMALVLGAAPVANASSNSLLSGYGGPGQGSQAILGSALLNGPSGGSPGSGSSATSSGASRASQPNGSSSGSASHHATRTTRSPRATSGRSGNRSVGGSNGYPSAHEAATATAPVPGSTLGLSGADFAYLALALVALAATAVLTRALASGRRGGRAHG